MTIWNNPSLQSRHASIKQMAQLVEDQRAYAERTNCGLDHFCVLADQLAREVKHLRHSQGRCTTGHTTSALSERTCICGATRIDE